MVALLPASPEIFGLRSSETGIPEPIDMWGEHFYRSISEVQDDPELMQQASEYGTFFGVNPDYTPAVALMIRNKILGPEADKEGLSNIGRHSILTGKTSEMVCGDDMLRIDPQMKYLTDMASYGHEYMKGLEILSKSKGCTNINGHTRHSVDYSYYEDYETQQPAIFQATSMYWPYETWIKEGMIGHILEREFDSIVGPVIYDDGSLGEDVLQPWTYRTSELLQRKWEASEREGRKYNYPCSAFTYLDQAVMPTIEDYLFNLLSKNNPDLVQEMSPIIKPDLPFTSIVLHQAHMRNMPVL